MAIELLFLGTGTSTGVPMIGCGCDVCMSDDSRDNRMRTSVWLDLDGFGLLIDAGPDLRMQCLNFKVPRVDAILITHTHADHILGLDDIRRFNQMQKGPIDLYARKEDLVLIDKIFGYTHEEKNKGNRDIPRLVFKETPSRLTFNGVDIIPMSFPHGGSKVHGYRIGPIGYCTDISEMSESHIDILSGVEVLVIGALRHAPHPKHFTCQQAIDIAHCIGAKKTYFIHMNHEVKHDIQIRQMPPNMTLAYDGLKITV